ncbi:alpha/beta-hydrolase [Parathielavia hyrcaniae]|uniref:Alpha/beta-hydrolase n=1 Tax=Parathielavia hyrcaniae TaxID=113614 RepID=A0AAN6T031_9PEZI|nr:alpha/beta-hydrolase [Parathielavia hyrcaniae]
MFDGNPTVIQEGPGGPFQNGGVAPKSSKPPTPLVLIHDGGGTIFSYHCLGNLGRPVYGIANPHYYGGRWEGGIPEMATRYLQFIKSAVPGGDIIIGGWSLGGLVSLEVARRMADDKDRSLNLLGIVMIDSVCPVVSTPPRVQVLQHVMQWGEHTREETKELVTRCFSEAVRMLGEWTLPAWEKTQGEEEEEGLRTPPPNTRPPPVVLLRAIGKVPVAGDGVARVDIHRLDRQLGWGHYRKDLVIRVIDIPGHHFNIFHTDDNLDTTTEAIIRACLDLEGMGSSG